MNRYIIYFLPDLKLPSIPVEADSMDIPGEEWDFMTFFRGIDMRTAEPVAGFKVSHVLYYTCSPIASTTGADS